MPGPLRVGSLFSGYLGLDMAVEGVFHAHTVWTSDISPGARKLLAHRFPGLPNLGDVTSIDWSSVEPVDIIAGGSPCFAASTPVLTRRGLVPIENVTTDDQVWTHMSRWRPVTATMTRTAPTVEFRSGFFCTPEHRLWLRTPEQRWVNDIRRYRRHLADAQWVPAADSAGLFAATPVNITAIGCELPTGLDWWQVGRFLADGYTTRGVHVYIGKDKTSDVSRFPGWYQRQQATALRLTMPRSVAAAAWLDQHFGHGAAAKTIPAFVLALPARDRQDLLDGYWSGDGHRFGQRSMRSVSVSPCLTVGISLVAASLGYSISIAHDEVPRTKQIEGRTVNQRPWWSVTATPDQGRYTERDGAWMWHKLRRPPTPGPVQPVYDLSVADDHSFVAAGIVVHNCQDVSLAGARAGMTRGTRSNLWVAMRDGVAALRPHWVVWENVQGAFSARAASAMEPDPGLLGDHPAGQPVLRALGRVLGDLASLGYDTQWCSVRASDVGAPHQRNRVFVLGVDTAHAEGQPWGLEHRDGESVGDPDSADRRERWAAAPGQTEGGRPRTNLGRPGGVPVGDTAGSGLEGVRSEGQRLAEAPAGEGLPGRADPRTVRLNLLPTPMVGSTSPAAHGQISGQYRRAMDAAVADWGRYTPAIRRWEQVVGPAPAPVEPNGLGGLRINPQFPEWMMGLPRGWITGVPGITRVEALQLAGNGVVPQQAAAALQHLLQVSTWQMPA